MLKGLQGAPEHNGKTGVVESNAGERQRVRLLDDDKVLGIRHKNLALAPRAVDTLSVKELKAVLQACDYEGTMAGMDKRDLQSAVTELCSPERTAEILVEQARKQQNPTSTSATTATTNSSASNFPTVNKDQMQSAADRMANMDPAQLQQQAAMMKAMPKDQLRLSNPMFTTMSDGQIDQMISQFEMMASNPAMMQQAANQVKNMSPEDLQRQQAAVVGANTNGDATSPSTSNTPSMSSTATGATSPPASANAAQMLSQMNPEQLKQQASMLRSMPPNQIRSMHPQFSNMSDTQIQQMASQMEMMADNPAMLKMAAETMGKMTPEQIAAIQQGRMPAGGMDASAAPGTAIDQAASLLSNMNGKQVKDMLKMAKENPDILKTAMPGADTTQMEKVINGLEGMDEKTLDRIIAFLGALQKALSPVIKVYQSANRAVGGHFFKILSILMFAMISYWWFRGKAVSHSADSMVDDEEVPILGRDEDEF